MSAPALIRGWTTVAICSVAEYVILASGHFLLNSGVSTSVAYAVPRPPLKMTISTGFLGSIPSGLSADLAPPPAFEVSVSPSSLLTQALSRPTAGVASSPTAAARRSRVRRSTSGLNISDIKLLLGLNGPVRYRIAQWATCCHPSFSVSM